MAWFILTQVFSGAIPHSVYLWGETSACESRFAAYDLDQLRFHAPMLSGMCYSLPTHTFIYGNSYGLVVGRAPCEPWLCNSGGTSALPVD